MKVLVIGGGGREHALAWKLKQSAQVSQVFVAPGNAGTARDPQLVNLPITDLLALREWAQAQGIGLTVVGPEAPLAAGAVDDFRAHGLAIFGPTQAAAQLESSKAFSKAFMQRHGIPTAAFEAFTDAALAHAYVEAQGAPIVVKADGLAAGKGVVVATTLAQAHEAIDFMLLDNRLGVRHNAGGARVVIEEFLEGEEASFIVVCDGTRALPLATSQDHKRLLAGDLGPNTGGMGAYSPAPVVTPQVHQRAMDEVIWPTLNGMAAEGMPFSGFLYAGLMVGTDGRVKTLEFNCRLGDPETQPILMRLQSDLAQLLLAAALGKLDPTPLAWDPRVALGVVLAAAGYPQSPRKGGPISGLPPDAPDQMMFHAGTRADGNGDVVVDGGRVLCATALADTLSQAREKAYALVRGVHFEGMQWRHDIGYRAL